MSKLAYARGNLEFSTIITFKPFFRENIFGFPRLITGGGPETGGLVLSTWDNKVEFIKNIVNNNKTNFFIFITLNYSDPFGK